MIVKLSVCKPAGLKEDVKELQSELAALAKETAEMDQMRNEQNTNHRQAKADLELSRVVCRELPRTPLMHEGRLIAEADSALRACRAA